MCGSAGGCTGCGRERRPGGSIPVRPPARPADPASAPHPLPSDSRPGPRGGAERPAVPGVRAGRSEGGCSPGRGAPRRRPTPTDRQPARASDHGPLPLPSPPGHPARPDAEHTRLHIAALVLEALDAVVLQAGVLGHGSARLRQRLLLWRRRRVEREGTEGEERALRDVRSARWPRRGGGAEGRRAQGEAGALACWLSR